MQHTTFCYNAGIQKQIGLMKAVNYFSAFHCFKTLNMLLPTTTIARDATKLD